MSKVAILGHSHVVALLDAIGNWRETSRVIAPHDRDTDYPDSFRGWHSANMDIVPFKLASPQGSTAFDDTLVSVLTAGTPGAQGLAKLLDVKKMIIGMSGLLRTIISEIADREVVISCLYGNEYVIYGMVDSLELYDFAPFEGVPEAYPLDRRYVRAHLDSHIVETIIPALIALRANLPNARIIQVAPPPPIEDPSNTAHWEAMEDMIRRNGFVRPSLRLKWYRAYLEAVRSNIEPLDITYLDIGDEVTTESGFLRPEYSVGLSHANVLYGQVLARRLAQLLGGTYHAPL